MFIRTDEKGKTYRYKKAVIDCSNDEPKVEQSHAKEVNINHIVKRYGLDVIAKSNQLRSQEFRFDDVTGNDFAEAMLKITKSKEIFNSLPSDLRKKFNNNPAEFLDFVQNEKNIPEMQKMGLIEMPIPEPEPQKVVVVNTEESLSESPEKVSPAT